MFDQPRLQEMHDFLNYLYTIGTQNTNITINDGLVYRQLCYYELDSDELDQNGVPTNYLDLFDKWIERNNEIDSDSKGMAVIHDPDWPQFLQYYSKNDYKYFQKSPDFIKLYIPVKYQNIYESVNVLFDYIRDSQMRHVSKVSDKMRTDNVIVRLDKTDLENAIKIINFIKNNNTIRNNLNKTNPFIPTINGIGFMYEKGISYNQEISFLISEYINNCIKLEIPPTLNDFYKWFKGNNNSKDADEIFSFAVGEKTYIEDIENEVTIEDKYHLFIGALKVTFLKYDMNQVMFALKKLLEDGDYSSFTNGNGDIKYRKELREKVTRNEIVSFLEKSIPDSIGLDYQSILYFCQKVFEKEMLNDFNNACLVTYSNYGIDNLKSAIKKLMEDGDPENFSRYSKDDLKHEKNYRKIIAQYDMDGIINLMKLSLDLNEIQYDEDDMDEIIELYTNNLTIVNSMSDDNSFRRR